VGIQRVTGAAFSKIIDNSRLLVLISVRYLKAFKKVFKH
jgi:hypothetical protein